MSMKRILLLVGDFSEDYEVMVPFQALLAQGHAVHAVCPGKAAGQSIATAVHDFGGYQTYTETQGHRFTLTHDFAGLDLADYDALLIPGGRAAEYQRLDPAVQALVAHFVATDKIIAAICHGVQLLTATGVVRGRRATAYPACRPEVEQAGGAWVETPLDGVCVDGKLITIPAWPAHPALLRALYKALA
ncbi:MAG: DJ-1/PfpI family protein [Dechloromonas sp.]|nr:DJ-1/PfpI family protein [Dechloromonas sp.]